MLLPSGQIKLGLMKDFVQGLEKDEKCLKVPMHKVSAAFLRNKSKQVLLIDSKCNTSSKTRHYFQIRKSINA